MTIDRIDSSKQPGFTLIELIVAMVIAAIVATITIRHIIDIGKLYDATNGGTQADADASMALSRMQKEFRQIDGTTYADSDHLTFTSLNGTSKDFQLLNGSDLCLNNNRLATDVGNFTLKYYNATNGLFTPLPVATSNLALIVRVSVELEVTKRGRTIQRQIDLFYPRQGTVK